MSDSVRPHRQQPTRFPCPWDSPGKNTGVGCHFLLQCMKVKVKSLSRVRPLATPWTAAYQAPPSMGVSRQEYWSGLPLPSPTPLINTDNDFHIKKGNISKFKIINLTLQFSLSVMSDSAQPPRRQPTRLRHPWDFPGKSTGVGCHCLVCNGILITHKKE